MKTKLLILPVLSLVPSFALAQGNPSTPTDFKSFLGLLGDFIDMAIPILVALTLLVFFWGLAKFILAVSGDEKAIQGGKDLMKWGIVALFVMTSVWGIVAFFSSDLFGPGIGVPQLPVSEQSN